MDRFVCLHGHFYQPPRENPWTNRVENEASAEPFKNWNERITSECYEANTKTEIPVEGSDQPIKINNYSQISFNFGPTLLSWMQNNTPEVYQAILEADQESQSHFSGHGAAIAQAYNHIIMPLANEQDKHTQVLWGIADFEHRFGRKPEGMWLPETAVDYSTLEVLAEHGIIFTILAPHQAKRVKRIQGSDWIELKDKKIDTHVPYLCRLPSGRAINVFFYNGEIAHEIAFGDALKSGEQLAVRLQEDFPDEKREALLAHVATDGETYGHHHKFANMALSYLLHYIQKSKTSDLTIYGEFLETHPPAYEVEILENSSWSCAHGVERWQSDCGCCINHDPEWNQLWRIPLREGLNWLRDQLTQQFEHFMKQWTDDPWAVRNAYIQYLLNGEEGFVQIQDFLKPRTSDEDRLKVLRLLEVQKFCLFSFTSCGWFFDDINGLEARQVLKYAARAIELSKEYSNDNLESGFLEYLSQAKSNRSKVGTGRDVYQDILQEAQEYMKA